MAMRNAPLMMSLAAEVMRKIRLNFDQRSMKTEDLATDLNGLTWALVTVEVLSESMALSIGDFMSELGRAKDREMADDRPEPSKVELPTPEDHPGDAPLLSMDLPDMAVVMKPAGWEVDNQDAGGGPWLSSWLMDTYELEKVPIVHYEEHQFGMLHRLDIPSSGLLIIGKTFEGFYNLKWQLQTGRIVREHVMLLHGHVPLDHTLNEFSHAEGAAEGTPAPAELKVLAHLKRTDDDPEMPETKEYTLVIMRFAKGRRLDLRTHFSQAGHATVADGKYSIRETYLRDREWCARKFMHSYRLVYFDVAGVERHCAYPLPHDLRESLAKLEPCCAASAAAAEAWISGAEPLPFDAVPELRASA